MRQNSCEQQLAAQLAEVGVIDAQQQNRQVSGNTLRPQRTLAARQGTFASATSRKARGAWIRHEQTLEAVRPRGRDAEVLSSTRASAQASSNARAGACGVVTRSNNPTRPRVSRQSRGQDHAARCPPSNRTCRRSARPGSSTSPAVPLSR